MRSADALVAAALLAALGHIGGCAIDLDEAPTKASPDADVPLLASCPVLAAPPERVGATGRVQVVTLAGGDNLVVVDSLEGRDASVPNAVWEVPAATPVGACLEGLAAASQGAASGLDASALDASASAGFLAVFALGDEVEAFVHTEHGFDALGIGLARYDRELGRFVAGADYLFAAGRPSYGDAALVDGGFVYAYGCASSGFLAEDCFVARAPEERVADPTAWAYYQDGNAFGADPDDAWAIFGGGSGLAVGRRGDRVVAAYVTPLGGAVQVRTGLGPTGPWSPAVAVTRCAFAVDGSFCGPLALQPALVGDAGDLVVGYGIRSFDALAVAQRLTRLVVVPAGP